MENLEIYTLGGVIDNLKPGQVAVKINSAYRDNKDLYESEEKILRQIRIGEVVFYNEEQGNILQLLRNKAAASITYAEPKRKGKYVILSKEDYFKMK